MHSHVDVLVQLDGQPANTLEHWERSSLFVADWYKNVFKLRPAPNDSMILLSHERREMTWVSARPTGSGFLSVQSLLTDRRPPLHCGPL